MGHSVASVFRMRAGFAAKLNPKTNNSATKGTSKFVLTQNGLISWINSNYSATPQQKTPEKTMQKKRWTNDFQEYAFSKLHWDQRETNGNMTCLVTHTQKAVDLIRYKLVPRYCKRAARKVLREIGWHPSTEAALYKTTTTN